MTLWRMHLRPTGMNARDVVRHCVENHFLGLGWGGVDEVHGEAPEDYVRRHEERWKSDGSDARRLLTEVAIGDLIWSRATDGTYLLGEVTKKAYPRFARPGLSGLEGRLELLDMFHVVPVTFVGAQGTEPVANTEVPGLIKARFSQRGRTLSRVNDKVVAKYTRWLFDQKLGRTVDPAPTGGRFVELLSAFELEDLVCLYLQDMGWRLVLSSHAPTTPLYEATMIRADGRTAMFQVKNGNAKLDAASYADEKSVDDVFLYAASGEYGASSSKNVTIIGEDELLEFAGAKLVSLPSPIRYWWSLSASAGSEPKTRVGER